MIAQYMSTAKRTYNVVSKLAYLIGVKRDYFDRGTLKPDIFELLDQNEAARRIRALCRVRNSLMRNFREIEHAINYDMKNLDTLPQYIEREEILYLIEHGVPIIKPNVKAISYMHAINQHITNSIHECSELFPLWIEWPFIRDLFIMPNATKDAPTRQTIRAFCYNPGWFPFQCYINWTFGDDEGHILHHDAKFLTLLYEKHGKVFNDYHMVTDAGHDTQTNFHNFILSNERVTFLVDCENSDPYRLCATFRNIASAHPDYVSHVNKVILYDDVNASTAWRLFDRYVEDVTVEHKVISRVKYSKSLVDVAMVAGACEEHYKHNTQAFVIVSSDSDFFALINALPSAKFLIMVEHGKQSQEFLDALTGRGVYYCYIDKFSQGTIHDIKADVLRMEINEYLNDAINLNIRTMLDVAYKKSRIHMSPAEEKAFVERTVQRIRLRFDSAGEASLHLP